MQNAETVLSVLRETRNSHWRARWLIRNGHGGFYVHRTVMLNPHTFLLLSANLAASRST